MSQDPTHEARLQERVPFRDAVNVVASANAPALKLRALNISEGGLCLQTTHPFRRGDRVGLRVTAGGVDLAIPVTEVAWVVREVKGSSRIPAVGLRFINLRPPQRQALKSLLDTVRDVSLPPLAGPGGMPSMAGASSSARAASSVPPLPPPVPTPATVPARPAPSPARPKPEARMQHEPSLPPLDGASTLPPVSIAIDGPAMPGPAARGAPSLAPLSAPPPPRSAEWSFSQDPSHRPTRVPLASPSMALAGGLLVVGTLAGIIFGVLDQRGSPTPPAPAPVAAQPASEGAPVVEAAAADVVNTVAEQAPAPAPVAATPQKPAVVQAAPVAAAPQKPAVVAAAPAPVQKPVVAAPQKPAAEKLPLPKVQPGHIALGAYVVTPRELVVPVRGVRRVDRTFVLQKPDRVVVDLDGDAFEGSAEHAGRGRVLKVRMGKRPGGVRMVLDVKDATVAKSARVERRNGVTAVVFPLK